ncbi:MULTISPECIES: helix-turn-helix domain-containing protein [unclassified Cupriavidus]|uniref:helix-turn-helix domain-containing protein n=1 Tax=unclassified Cupriavidus TaxID=2640874 RepID=UPI000B84FA4E|nr:MULTISPECIES: helix-turn-helix transcriptional regulator [unclassified Cupriavidus]
MKTLAERLLHARKTRGLSQAALGELVGLSQPMIRKIEQGSETSKVVELAIALGVRPQWLASGAEPMSDSSQKRTDHSLPQEPAKAAAIDRLLQAAQALTIEQVTTVAAVMEAMTQGSFATNAVIRKISREGAVTDFDIDTGTEAPPTRKRKTK